MQIISRKEIEQALDIPSILACIEEGFVLYSQQQATIPPVGTLHFSQPPGDCHIKYGYSYKSPYYVVKVASAFYQNAKHGLPTGNGLMLLFDKATGRPTHLLLDEGILTDLRTAAAGCIAAKYLAPKNISCIGIIGTGAQAYLQLKLLSYVTACRKVKIWGRNRQKAEQFCSCLSLDSFAIDISESIKELASDCNFILTTTSSPKALLLSEHIQKGTHITAVGADDIGKQELDPLLFARADRIIVDSRSQCTQFGDTSYALQLGLISQSQMIEMGEMIIHPSVRRLSEDELTIADLTGVAIQDLQIAQAVVDRLPN